MKKALIYIRVSTQEQNKEGYSVQAQREKLIAYCKAKGWIIHDIVIDGGYSGTTTDRPGLDCLLNSLEDIDVVLVYKLDRLARSQKDTLYLIEDKFTPKNVDFVSMTENFDTTTPLGKLMIGILSAFAQLEVENTKERTRMGRIERAKKGLWAGPPNPPLGYDLVESYLIVNEYEKLQVEEVFKLYMKGYGIQRIQNYMIKKGYTNKYGTWENVSSNAVNRIIENRHYIGEVSFAREWYKGIHEPIIDLNTFNRANKLRQKRIGTSTRLKHFLSGTLYCGECGEKYVLNTKNGKSYHICKNRKYAYQQDFKCNNTIFRTEVLEEMAINKIKDILNNKDDLIKEKYIDIEEPIVNNHEVLSNRIKDIDKQIDKLMDLYQIDNIPIETISERISKLDKEKKSIALEIQKIQDNSTVDIDIEEILEILKDFDLVWDKLEAVEKRDITKALLGEKLYVTNKGI